MYDRGDTKIGKAGQVYVDAASGEPEWLCVNTGLFGTKESFVPLTDAQFKGDDVYVAFDKDQVKQAPNIDPTDEGIMAEQERRLYDYYGGLGWQPPGRGGTGQATYSGTREGEVRGTREAETRGTREAGTRGTREAETRGDEVRKEQIDTDTPER